MNYKTDYSHLKLLPSTLLPLCNNNKIMRCVNEINSYPVSWSFISDYFKFIPSSFLETFTVTTSKCLFCYIMTARFFYPIKNISGTSELPVRSCENRRSPLWSRYGFTWIMTSSMYADGDTPLSDPLGEVQ